MLGPARATRTPQTATDSAPDAGPEAVGSAVAVLEAAPHDLPNADADASGAEPSDAGTLGGAVRGGVLPTGLSVRLALRARPLSLARRLALAALSAATGYLLLACLADAADAPWGAGVEAVRLAWCLAPVAVVLLAAVAVGRAETSDPATAAFAGAGIGPARLPLLAAAQVAQAALVGSAGSLVVFVYLREQATAPAPLPYAGLATLLLALPLLAAAACLISLRPLRLPRAVRPAAAAAGAAAFAAGAVLVRLGHAPAHGGIALPGGLGRTAQMAFAGWALALLGPLLAMPGVLALTGMLLAAIRPGARRLLAGRALRSDAGRLGLPAGVLAAAVCAAWSAHVMRHHATRPAGHLTLVAAAVVVVGALACLAAAADAVRHSRRATTHLLTSLGAPSALPRTAALLRTAVALTVCLPLTAVVAWLAVPGVTH